MVISLELGEWILSAIIQAQAAIMGLNLATIGITVAFLYRNGEFHRYPDSYFVNSYKGFKTNIKRSLVVGFFGIGTSLFGLLSIETFDSNTYRVLFCYTSAILIIISTASSLFAGSSVLNTINKHMQNKGNN